METTKVSFNVPTSLIASVSERARSTERTTTHVICQALKDYLFFEQARERGEKILLEDACGKFREVVWPR